MTTTPNTCYFCHGDGNGDGLRPYSNGSVRLICHTCWQADQAEEAEAKAKWEDMNPAPGTIEWYEKFFAEHQDVYLGDPQYYRTMMRFLAEYRQERADHGHDESWLAVLREQCQEVQRDVAEMAAREAARKAALEAGSEG